MRNIDPSRLTDEELEEIQRRKRGIALAEQAEQLVVYCGSDELFGQEKPAEHHALLCAFLQQVERGEIDRLMIFMPPGSAKSTYTSVRFASWYLGRHPQDSIIQACHTAKLAQRFGRKVRNLNRLRKGHHVQSMDEPVCRSRTRMRKRLQNAPRPIEEWALTPAACCSL